MQKVPIVQIQFPELGPIESSSKYYSTLCTRLRLEQVSKKKKKKKEASLTVTLTPRKVRLQQ